jgi:hypothetical protein
VADYAEQLPDPAPWHPVDMRVVIVPASSVAVDAAAGPVNDPKLVWATVQATEEGAEAIGRAVDAAVQRMETSSGAHFRPLERAHDIAGLLTGGRAPANAVEAELVAATLPKPKFPSVAVSVVAASDDESPEPAESYRLDFVVSGLAFEIAAGIVTPGARHQRDLDVARFPRLSRWAFNRTWSPFIGCGAEGAPFTLFEEWCVDYRYRCDGRPIEQLSPGLGSCYIETTTVDPPACAAERGWADPKDSDGVRRPHVDERGEHVCEVMPVEPRYMDACIHDETCADCGNGWCVTETRADERFCGPYFKLSPIRWVGGALPAPGTVRITCREPQ